MIKYLKRIGEGRLCSCGKEAGYRIGKSVYCGECALKEIEENYKLVYRFKANGFGKDSYVDYEIYKEEIENEI